ncbi:MAG: PQQ-like beta-propeller repeat protein, partial [Cystobacterineae bacterium]|nr:PQQ-like beta-propeller repeat protein [Cystobacterineae bacterium]
LGGEAGLNVWATRGEERLGVARCETVQNIGGVRYRWTCILGAGFAGQGPTVQVHVQSGKGGVQIKTYLVATAAPHALFNLSGSGLLGTTLTVCATARDGLNAAANFLVFGSMSATLDGSALALTWVEGAENAATRKCRSSTLPLDRVGVLELSADIIITDVAHNLSTHPKKAQLALTRLATSHTQTGISNVVVPLAWTNGHLAIGTSNPGVGEEEGRVYFYNGDSGALGSVSEVGALIGLSVLGSSGRVAIATGGGGGRIALLEASGLMSSNNICTARDIAPQAYFPHPPTLLGIGGAKGEGWRFALPANGKGTHLLAYLPEASTCTPHLLPLAEASLTPLVGLSNAEVLLAWGSSPIWFYTWRYNASNNTWAEANVVGASQVGGHISTLVMGATHFWTTHIGATGAFAALMRQDLGHTGDGAFMTQVASFEFLSAPALDAQGRAYVVAKSAGEAYRLHRYATNDTPPTWSHAPLGTPVGSPLLGEARPDSPAEVYVLTTNGALSAFRADTLELLWTENLNISVSPMAQPILTGNRLWVVGEGGEIYALAVNSQGLSRSAQWPTLYRDNCNSNSLLSSPSSLPECFE